MPWETAQHPPRSWTMLWPGWETKYILYLTDRDSGESKSQSYRSLQMMNHWWFCCLTLCCFITQFSHICIPFLFPGDDGAQTNPENSSQENRIKARCRSCSSVLLKAVWGLLIILSVSSSWVGTTQIVKITYKNFYCPFFMTWFSTNWNIMFFPVYYSGHLATAQVKQSPMKKFR